MENLEETVQNPFHHRKSSEIARGINQREVLQQGYTGADLSTSEQSLVATLGWYQTGIPRSIRVVMQPGKNL